MHVAARASCFNAKNTKQSCFSKCITFKCRHCNLAAFPSEHHLPQAGGAESKRGEQQQQQQTLILKFLLCHTESFLLFLTRGDDSCEMFYRFQRR